jgi:hypothetical protein
MALLAGHWEEAREEGERQGKEERRGGRGIVAFLVAPGRLHVLKVASRRWQQRAQALDTHLLEELR